MEIDSCVSSNATEIIKEIKTFYTKLYTKTEIDLRNSEEFIAYDFPILKEKSRKSCEGKIEQGECLQVLKEMKINKITRKRWS